MRATWPTCGRIYALWSEDVEVTSRSTVAQVRIHGPMQTCTRRLRDCPPSLRVDRPAASTDETWDVMLNNSILILPDSIQLREAIERQLRLHPVPGLDHDLEAGSFLGADGQRSVRVNRMSAYQAQLSPSASSAA